MFPWRSRNSEGVRYLLSRESTTSSSKEGADFEYREGEIETVIDATRQIGSALDDSEIERALMAGVRDAAATTLPLLEGLIFVSQLPEKPLTPKGEAHSKRFLKFHEIAMQLNAAVRDDNKFAWSEAADRWIENSNEEEKESIRRTLNELTNNQMSSEARDAPNRAANENWCQLKSTRRYSWSCVAVRTVSPHKLCRCSGCD